MQCRRMKFGSAGERSVELKDLNFQHHRIMQNSNETSSAFVPTAYSTNLHLYFSL